MLLICQNSENHSPEVLICLHWWWSSLHWQIGFYGKKKKKNMYWENCGFFLQKSETFPLHFSPTSLTKLPRSILYRIWWAFHQRHGNLISAFFFCRNLCKSADYSHAMASATPHLLFCRQTPLIQSYLNWTQHSHWVFTGVKGGEKITSCHFQAPLLFIIWDEKFVGLRTVYHLQIMFLHNIYILFLLIVTTLCPSKKVLC